MRTELARQRKLNPACLSWRKKEVSLFAALPLKVSENWGIMFLQNLVFREMLNWWLSNWPSQPLLSIPVCSKRWKPESSERLSLRDSGKMETSDRGVRREVLPLFEGGLNKYLHMEEWEPLVPCWTSRILATRLMLFWQWMECSSLGNMSTLKQNKTKQTIINSYLCVLQRSCWVPSLLYCGLAHECLSNYFLFSSFPFFYVDFPTYHNINYIVLFPLLHSVHCSVPTAI